MSHDDRSSLVENQAYYDAFSRSYEDRRHDGYHLLIDDLESDLVCRAASGKRALEVGCGTGLILERVHKTAARAMGIDLSAGMLSVAKQRKLNVAQASATALPFADESFDIAYSFKVLSHVPDLELALAEMARVTRPGGRVFIELYNRRSLRYVIRRLRGGHAIGDTGLDDNRVFVRFYRPAEMRAALPPALSIVRTHGVRIATVVPQSVGWPVVGQLLKRAEWALRSSPLAKLGGFVVLECERR